MKFVEKHLHKFTYIRRIYLSALFTTAAVLVGRNIALTKNSGIYNLILAQHIIVFAVISCYGEAVKQIR